MPNDTFIVTTRTGQELARFTPTTTPPDRDGDVIPMRAATQAACRERGRRVYRVDGDALTLMLESVPAVVHQPIDAFGSTRGRRRAA